MKLYGVSDGPPSFACRMVLKALNIPYELIPVNYNVGEHLTDEYFKVFLQKHLTFVTLTHLFVMFYIFLFFSFVALVESSKRNSST